MNPEPIILHEDESGFLWDRDGNAWAPFTVDPFAQQEPGECCICGEETESGYMSLAYGGEEAHEWCVEFEEPES